LENSSIAAINLLNIASFFGVGICQINMAFFEFNDANKIHDLEFL
jgi:hypothetical protein